MQLVQYGWKLLFMYSHLGPDSSLTVTEHVTVARPCSRVSSQRYNFVQVVRTLSSVRDIVVHHQTSDVNTNLKIKAKARIKDLTAA